MTEITRRHTDEEHKIESEEIYEKIKTVIEGACSASAEMAIVHSLFDVLMGGYPTFYTKEMVIEHFSDITTQIINNMMRTFNQKGDVHVPDKGSQH